MQKKVFFTLLAALLISNISSAQAAILDSSLSKETNTVHQVPGYFVQKIGNIKVTALFDGEIGLPRTDLLRISAKKADKIFSENFVPVNEKTKFSPLLMHFWYRPPHKIS